MVSVTQVWPRKVIFGPGALIELKDEVAKGSFKKVTIITDPFLAQSNTLKRIQGLVDEVGCVCSLFGEVEANPRDVNVDAAGRAIAESRSQLIIALGGGSSIDCAKAANVAANHGGPVTHYMGPEGSEKIDPLKLLPLVAIPTTAGTGSEASNVAVVTDTRVQRKYGVLSKHIVPDVSILDPELTLSLPPHITAWTGMDALTHAIEAYVSNLDFPVANILALEAIKLVAEFLPQAVADGQNLLAREKMLLASHLAIMAANGNRLGLVHSLAHQLSSEFGLNHGLANAVPLPFVMRFNLECARRKYAEVARALGVKEKGLTEAQLGEKGVEAVERLSRRIGISKKIEDCALTEESLERVVANAMEDGLRLFNPRDNDEQDIRALYRLIF